jgi:hypothetical protein
MCGLHTGKSPVALHCPGPRLACYAGLGLGRAWLHPASNSASTPPAGRSLWGWPWGAAGGQRQRAVGGFRGALQSSPQAAECVCGHGCCMRPACSRAGPCLVPLQAVFKPKSGLPYWAAVLSLAIPELR